MSLSERIHQLNSEIGASVERALAELRQEISQRLRASNEEIQRRLDEITPSLPPSYLNHDDFAPHERALGTNARQGAHRDLRDALAGIDRARSQTEVLSALLRESARYASRTAVLLVRGSELRGWGSEGFGDAEAALRGVVLDGEGGAWGRLAQSQGAELLSAADCATLISRVGSPLPHDGALVPIVLRDRVAAGLYADRLDDRELGVEALQILAHAAAQAIETLPFRERSSTPTLALEGGNGGGIGVGGAAAPAAAEAPAYAPEPEPEAQVAPEPQATSWTGAPAQEEEMIETAPGLPADLPAEAPREETSVAGSLDGSSIPNLTEAMPLPGFPMPYDSPLATPPESMPAPEPMDEEVPRYPRSVEEPPAPARTPDPSPDATVLLQRSSLTGESAVAPTPAAATPLRPVPASVPAEEPAAAPFERAAGTPEVRPPSGVDGPGWAFATTRVPVNPDNQALHEEARRLARLLVSEIKLYNEEQVEEGRRNRDVYERLREDIDRSRQMYDERVDPQILRSTDYFYQELVRILAAGDSKALGI